MDSDLEQRLNRGLIVEQRGLEGGGWRRRARVRCDAPLAPPPHYIGGQGAVLADLGGVDSSWDSYPQRETFPPGSLSPMGTPPLSLAPPTS